MSGLRNASSAAAIVWLSALASAQSAPPAQPPVQQPIQQPIQLPTILQPVPDPIEVNVLQQPLQPALIMGSTDASARVARGAEPVRPYRALFGGTAVAKDAPGLTAVFTAHGGHDDDLRAAQSGTGSQGTDVEGGFFGAGASLDYNRPGQKLILAGNFSTQVRHYPPVDDTTEDFFGNFSADIGVSRRARLIAVQSIEYASAFRFSQIPGLGLVPGADVEGPYLFSDNKRTASATNLTIRYSLNSRSALYGRGSYLTSTTEGTVSNRWARSFGGGFQRQMTRRFTLNLGYDRQESLFDDGVGNRPRTIVNNIGIGANYVRPLSSSRRTTVAFTMGTGAIAQELPGVSRTEAMRATGSARIRHLAGRTWTIEGYYDRGLQFVELSPDPYFVNSLRAQVTGMLHPRLEFRATGSFADGQLRLQSEANQRTSISGRGRLGWALNRQLELSADYSYYFYEFADPATIGAGTPPKLHRRTVRVTLGYWVPLILTR